MKIFLFFLAVAAVLLGSAAFNDRPAIRRAMAQCEMDRRANMDSGQYDTNFLTLCMQAKGFAAAPKNASAVPRKRCSELPYPAVEAECYSPDTWYTSLGR